MKDVVKLFVGRDGYTIGQVIDKTITVGELIRILENMDEDAKVVFDNDDGYTFGWIDEDRVEECYFNEEDEL